MTELARFTGELPDGWSIEARAESADVVSVALSFGGFVPRRVTSVKLVKTGPSEWTVRVDWFAQAMGAEEAACWATLLSHAATLAGELR